MRILLAGATGAIGQHLTPSLVASGHTVFGTTRTPTRVRDIEAAGATALLMDGLDAPSVNAAVEAAKPDVVIHELTALAHGMNTRTFDRDFAMTNRLRTQGTDNLLEAARRHGVTRFIAQSFTGWSNDRRGVGPADESTPLDEHPGREARATLAAMRHLEAAVTGRTDLAGLVLRYGILYGPGTSITAHGGDIATMVRRRRFPVVGNGAGVWSFVHAADAAAATVAAVDRGEPGLYNVVDDAPAPVAEWLPGLAAALGAKPPMHVPVWLARPLIGEHGVIMMTRARGSSNAKARRDLAWTPRYPSWRVGFTDGL